MKNEASISDKSGSRWRRWEPHIHTPLTTLNNQFKSSTMEDFCDAIEAYTPSIEVLGVTDYCSLRGYRELVALKDRGRLPGVGMIFPNVELRLNLGTVKGSAINAHLLFSPEDPNHLAEVERFLGKIPFSYLGEDYCCTEADLIRLGKTVNPAIVDDNAAFEEGVRQYKVDPQILTGVLSKNTWARQNCLFAVAAGRKDGMAGLRTDDGGFKALRESVEASADLIFSSNAGDADFWLGRSATASEEEIERKYRNLKPCLHGSDAHDLAKVGKPDDKRHCWIKGSATFESLRQACIEPSDRVRIADEAPRGSAESRTILSTTVTNAPWMKPCTLELNPGLVAIIGARGSGKTALADLIAAGGYSASARINERSFIARAAGFLGSSRTELSWESGEVTGNSLGQIHEGEAFEFPRVQYLSQQFVDTLCSAEGITDGLVEEVQRVIFDAHSVDDREGASSFGELYQLRCREALERRRRCEDDLEMAASELLKERSLKQELPDLTKKRLELLKMIADDTRDRSKLVSPAQEARAKRQQEIAGALQKARIRLEGQQKSLRAVKGLQGDLEGYRNRGAMLFVKELRDSRADAGLADAEWSLFKPTISADADALLAGRIGKNEEAIRLLLGVAVEKPAPDRVDVALIADTTNLETCSVNLLQAESDRLTGLIGIDRQNASKYKALGDKIAASQKSLETLDQRIERCGKAEDLERALMVKRKDAYRGVFEAIVALEDELKLLYSPLGRSLGETEGALSRLKFVIRRKVNLAAWTTEGENLLDLRKMGPFQRKGTLRELAETKLFETWKAGSPEEVSETMNAFINESAADIKSHILDSMNPKDWRARVSEWLHSTRHLSVEYGLQYEGVDIERLSPGTRGIVLLLLYLEIDKNDDRPLIIDQPEENLDPQSVYDELVPRFRSARLRRQIIIVTHNANLVVNTDVDQVIVATAGYHKPGNLPEIAYRSGGLEDQEIRKLVCNILEGGARAFEARAKRLRVPLKRD